METKPQKHTTCSETRCPTALSLTHSSLTLEYCSVFDHIFTTNGFIGLCSNHKSFFLLTLKGQRGWMRGQRRFPEQEGNLKIELTQFILKCGSGISIGFVDNKKKHWKSTNSLRVSFFFFFNKLFYFGVLESVVFCHVTTRELNLFRVWGKFHIIVSKGLRPNWISLILPEVPEVRELLSQGQIMAGLKGHTQILRYA